MSVRGLAFLLLFLAVPVLAQDAAPPERYARTPEELVPYRDYGAPYRLLFREPLAFRGAGHEKEVPAGLTEVRIGLLAPPEDSPEGRQGRGLRRGAQMAVAEANAAGGFESLPFRLMDHPDLPIWGASSNEIVAMAWEEKVWAILGSVSGDSSHIAIRVALKAEVAVMNTATTDPTFTETGIPWAFRCIADDRQQSYALALHVFRDHGFERVVVIRSNDRYGRFGVMELRDAAKRLGHPLLTELKWLPGDTDFQVILERARDAEPDAIVVWGDAETSALLLRQMREMGMEQPVFGSAALADPLFAETAGEAAEGVVVAATFDPTAPNPRYERFRAAFTERFGEEPDTYSAHAYDGMELVLAAIREVGLNRPRIRDFLAAVREYDGVTGRIVFDNTMNDVGEVPLAVYRGGELRYSHGEARLRRDGLDKEGVTVGLLLPSDGSAKDVERGLRTALAGLVSPPRLVTRTVEGPWTSVGEITRDLVRDDGAAVVVSALDGAGSHVAAQVATRLRFPLVVATPAPELLRHTGVPWIHLPERSGLAADGGRFAAVRLSEILELR